MLYYLFLNLFTFFRSSLTLQNWIKDCIDKHYLTSYQTRKLVFKSFIALKCSFFKPYTSYLNLMQHPLLHTNSSFGSKWAHYSNILLISSLHFYVFAKNFPSLASFRYNVRLASSSCKFKSIMLIFDWEAQILHHVNLVMSAMIFL